MVLLLLGRDVNILKNLVNDAMEYYYSKFEKKTWIYKQTEFEDSWRIVSSIVPKPIQSIILPEGVAEMVLDDIKLFLQSSEWYKSCGIPWNRGYLFYG